MKPLISKCSMMPVASAGSYIRTCRRIRNSKKIATIRDFHQNICVNPTIILYLYDIKNIKEGKEVTFPLCSSMCFRLIKLTLNAPCKKMAKVSHFVFTTHHSKDHNFYTWPWINTILKSSYTQEDYVSTHWIVVAVLYYFFRNKTKMKIV